MSSDEGDDTVEEVVRVRGQSIVYEAKTTVYSEESLKLLYGENSLLYLMKRGRCRGSSTFLYCSHRANGCKFIAKLIKDNTSGSN